MSYALSRLMSTATASYAGYCFVHPEHLGNALGADKDEHDYARERQRRLLQWRRHIHVYVLLHTHIYTYL